MPVWRVVRESDIDSRYEAKRSAGRLPLVGRQEELGLLLRSWESAKDRHGQVVLIQGEPGIGKSRLLEALREHVADENYLWSAARCSLYHANSALYPVIEHLKRAVGWKPEDGVEKKIEKLEASLQRQSLPLEEVMPLYAELFSLPLSEDRYAPLNLEAKQKRERTLDALSGWLLEEAERTPVLQVWEDLHWADPTTLELLGLYIEQSPTVSMLNVLTYRPEFIPPWMMRSHMTPITLNRLERAEVEALIEYQASGKSVPSEVIEHIVDKADGVPLYVEELTKTILKSDYLNEDTNRFTLDGSLSELAIPATLQDSLMARLDRLPTLREIAQLGAVLGREFAYEMLHSLASHDELILQDGLGQLVEDELLYQRGRPPRSKYIFKHALIQDAAYQSLLKRTRRQYHQQIAQLLEERFTETVTAHPELVAHHYQEAGCTKEAVAYWLKAGQRSIARSANLEAIAHLMNGLDLVAGLPSGPEISNLELDMQISLGSASIAAQGYSAVETEEIWLRARELLGNVEADSRQFAVLHGLCMVYWNRAQLDRMREVNEDMLRRAMRQKDILPQLVAHRVMAVGLNPMGKFEEARKHAQNATELYDPEVHNDTAHRFGHDQGVGAYWHLSISLLFLGYPDASADAAVKASEFTAKLGNVNTKFYTALWSSYTDLVRRDWRSAKETASQMVAQASELAMPLWVAFGHHLLGCSLVSLGDVDSGLKEIHRGRREAETLNNSIFKPMTLRFEAQALAVNGRYSDASNCLDDALRIVSETEERWWESDIHCLKAVCSQAIDGDHSKIEARLRQAMAVASNQKSRLLELRSAIELAKHWREQDKSRQAQTMLIPIYEWFSEGFDTPDLQEARALLEEYS